MSGSTFSGIGCTWSTLAPRVWYRHAKVDTAKEPKGVTKRVECKARPRDSHLRSIFNAGDIKKQLPAESAKFQEIAALATHSSVSGSSRRIV